MTAALDLSFCIDVNGIDQQTVLEQLETMNHGHYEMFSEVEDDELQLLKEIFSTFQNRTRCCPSKDAVYDSLKKFDLDEYFNRAVLYHLTTSAVYDNIKQDPMLITKQLTPNLHLRFQTVQKNLCNWCKSEVATVMKCSKCLVAIYCNRQCQKNDWRTLKKSQLCQEGGGCHTHYCYETVTRTTTTTEMLILPKILS